MGCFVHRKDAKDAKERNFVLITQGGLCAYKDMQTDYIAAAILGTRFKNLDITDS